MAFYGDIAVGTIALLEGLLKCLKKRNLNGIFLGTTEKYLAAHRFYEKNGFIVIDKGDLLTLLSYNESRYDILQNKRLKAEK